MAARPLSFRIGFTWFGMMTVVAVVTAIAVAALLSTESSAAAEARSAATAAENHIEVSPPESSIVVGTPESSHVFDVAEPSSVVVSTHESKEAPLVVGYYAGWATYSGREVAEIAADQLTHVIYAFANIGADLTISIGDIAIDVNKRFPGDSLSQLVKGNYNQLNILKERHPHLKTLIGVGGWSWSGRFSDVALTQESRAAFAESVVRFITAFGFDGVDMDWEYPVSGGLPGNARRPEDRRNFTLLMRTLREHLDAQSEKDGKEYLLTFAAAASTSYVANVELQELHPIVDFINLMTYDIHGPWDSMTGLVAPLYRDPESEFPWEWSVDDAVELYLREGVPQEKLVVGVPFYGYRYTGVTPDHRGGLYQPFTRADSVSYADIAATPWAMQGAYPVHESAQVPYAWVDGDFISFEDPDSIAAKGAYIRERGLRGAMIWDVSQDTRDHALLRALHSGLLGLIPPSSRPGSRDIPSAPQEQGDSQQPHAEESPDRQD